MKNCTVYQGHARFESSKEVSVGSERLTADRIFINVGGRAVVPQMHGIESVPYLNNSSIMDVDFLPRHLVIVRGGYIGPEFAQMYRRFGSEVTIIDTGSHLARHEDEDVSTAIQEILEHEGIHVRLNATCIGFSKRGGEILAQVDCVSGDPEVSGSHVLLAVGRRPNTNDLGLTEAGVAVDKRGKAHSPTRPSTMLKLSGRIFWTMTRAKSAIALPLMLCTLPPRSAVQACGGGSPQSDRRADWPAALDEGGSSR